MSEVKEPKKMGRPKKVISEDDFEKLCDMQATKDEIANWFHCSPDTIENWCHATFDSTFSAIYKKLASNGKISLRRAMFKKAITDENTTMQIWLSKQHLDMKDQEWKKEEEKDQTPRMTPEEAMAILEKRASSAVQKKL